MAKKKGLKDIDTSGSWIDYAINQFVDAGAQRFSDVDVFKDGTWSSINVPSFDFNMDFLGFPSGIIEITGESMSGKTTMAYQALTNAKRDYGDRCVPIILSAENRDNRDLANGMGLTVNEVMILRPKTIEHCQNLIVSNVNKIADFFEAKGEEKPKFVFLLDSMGQMMSASEANKIADNAEADDEKAQNPGASAKANNAMLRTVKVLCQDHDITFLVINRQYKKIGFKASGSVSAGGTGITYLPTVRIHLRKVKDITTSTSDRPIGQEVEVTSVKNDYGSPRHKFTIELMFGYGYVISSECIAMARELGLIEKYGYGWKSTIDGIEVGWKSKNEFLDLLASQDQGLIKLTKRLTEEAHAKVIEKRAKQNK